MYDCTAVIKVDLSETSIDHLTTSPPHHHHLSPCCFFCVLLCVIQHCQRSSCAPHSAPTAAAAGSVLRACGRSALHSQTSVRCWCHRHGPMHVPAAKCVRHFLLGTDHPGIDTSSRLQQKSFVKHRVQLGVLFCISWGEKSVFWPFQV